MLKQRSYDWNPSSNVSFRSSGPLRGPLCLIWTPSWILSHASAVLAVLPGLELSLFFLTSSLQTSCEGRGWSGNNLWQTPSCSVNGQTNTLIHPPPPLNPRTGLCQLWRCHYWRARRFLAFCVPPHSALLIPSSPFKPVCFLSSMHPPPCSTPRSVCACRLLELQVFFLFFFWQRKTKLRQAFVPPGLRWPCSHMQHIPEPVSGGSF